PNWLHSNRVKNNARLECSMYRSNTATTLSLLSHDRGRIRSERARTEGPAKAGRYVRMTLRTMRLGPVRLQNFVDEEKIGKQRAQVNRRVEVVDDLRADGRLGDHELDR